jgi:hypothetical protein
MMLHRPAFLASLLTSLGAAVAPAAAQTVNTAPVTSLADLTTTSERHRQVFASVSISHGAVLKYMRNSLNGFADGLHEGPGTLKAVAVLYGTSLAIALNDDAWKTYGLAAQLGLAPDPAGGNPFRNIVAELVARDARLLMCNNALVGFSGTLASTPALLGKTTTAHVRESLIAAFLPGVTLVPAGVTALAILQEARYTLIQASLE